MGSGVGAGVGSAVGAYEQTNDNVTTQAHDMLCMCAYIIYIYMYVYITALTGVGSGVGSGVGAGVGSAVGACQPYDNNVNTSALLVMHTYTHIHKCEHI